LGCTRRKWQSAIGKLDAREGLQHDLPLMDVDVAEDQGLNRILVYTTQLCRDERKMPASRDGGSMHGTVINRSRKTCNFRCR
jgi:hypothetical protein